MKTNPINRERLLDDLTEEFLGDAVANHHMRSAITSNRATARAAAERALIRFVVELQRVHLCFCDHLVLIGTDGYTLAHTDPERKEARGDYSKLEDCDVARYLTSLDGPPLCGPGLYIVQAPPEGRTYAEHASYPGSWRRVG